MRPAPMLKEGGKKGYPLSCLVSLPKGHPGNAESDGPWPVLCYLHGIRESAGYCVSAYPEREGGQRYDGRDIHEAITAALRSHGPLKPGSALPDDKFIVVVPQLPGIKKAWNLHARDVEAILACVKDQFNADLGRAYLTGFSIGANGVYDLYNDQATVHWAKLWLVDPTRTFDCPGLPPIWLWYGSDQKVCNDRTVENLVGVRPVALAGWRCSYTGKGHVPTATDAYQDRGVYDWLSD
jgi:hypothetical protein